MVPIKTITGSCIFAVTAAVFFPVQAAAPPQPDSSVARRLTAAQYQETIKDIFGEDIQLGGRLEPDVRVDGLLAIGAGEISVTPAGMEQYDGNATVIAQQVIDDVHRDSLIPCKPVSPSKSDDACARQFFTKVGRLLYRRPLTGAELASQLAIARSSTELLGGFYNGLSASLATMLEAPQFLFRDAAAGVVQDRNGGSHLDAYSKAAKLSFLLWNSTPDSTLLAAAESGALDTDAGLTRETGRLLASPRLEAGVRAFFSDMLEFDAFDSLTKDQALYPSFTAKVAADAQEQTLRTIVELLVKRRGDYRDIFTTPKTFLTQALGALYGVPVLKSSYNGAPDSWQPHEFADSDPRVGILAQASFVAMHSPPGRGSATLRGKALREVLLCQKVPPPPANIKFDLVEDTKNPIYKTARARLEAHRTDAVCAGCHKIIDPLGMGLENFDGGGAYRLTENGVAIDASGELNGRRFKDARGLAQALHDDPAASSCLVNRLTSYALGRPATTGEKPWIAALETGFAGDGYRLPDLMQRIVLSPEFYRVGGSAAINTSNTTR